MHFSVIKMVSVHSWDSDIKGHIINFYWIDVERHLWFDLQISFFFVVVLWTIFGGVFLNNLFLQIFISCSNSVSFRIRIPSIFFFNTLTENSISSIVILLSSNRRLEQKRGKVRLNATIQTHVAKKSLLFLL